MDDMCEITNHVCICFLVAEEHVLSLKPMSRVGSLSYGSRAGAAQCGRVLVLFGLLMLYQVRDARMVSVRMIASVCWVHL